MFPAPQLAANLGGHQMNITKERVVTDEEYGDDPDYSEETPCDHCDGDGMDPMTDYLLPCPFCQGEQKP